MTQENKELLLKDLCARLSMLSNGHTSAKCYREEVRNEE